jgi:hypothetical protein
LLVGQAARGMPHTSNSRSVSRHRDVHHHDIGLEHGRQVDYLKPVTGLADDHDIVRVRE